MKRFFQVLVLASLMSTSAQAVDLGLIEIGRVPPSESKILERFNEKVVDPAIERAKTSGVIEVRQSDRPEYRRFLKHWDARQKIEAAKKAGKRVLILAGVIYVVTKAVNAGDSSAAQKYVPPPAGRN